MSEFDRSVAPRRAVRGALFTLLASTAVLGAVSASAPGAGATPPFHCKASPNGQDCTNGSDPGGGGWTAPDHYDYLGPVDHGLWDQFERSDGAIPGSDDFILVELMTGFDKCTWGVTGPRHQLTSKIDCQ